MLLLLTCECGARFEAEDHLGGQEVLCPECLRPVRSGARQSLARLDWLALVSVAVALIGAFTVVGSAAAVVVGVVALIRIRRQPEVLAGSGVALVGIALGLALTALTLGVLSIPDILPVGAWLQQRRLAGQLDAVGTLHHATADGVCLMTAPAGWSRLRTGSTGDPAVSELQQKRDVILVNPRLHAFADLYRDPDPRALAIEAYFDIVLHEFLIPRKPLVGDDDDENPLRAAAYDPTGMTQRKLEIVDGFVGQEWVFDLRRGGHTWRFLIRLYRKAREKIPGASPIYVVRIYSPRRRFFAADQELRALAESVRFSP